MRFNRIRIGLFSALLIWIVGATAFWLQYVPNAPLRIIPLNADEHLLAGCEDGIFIAHLQKGWFSGPIRTWSFESGELSPSFLTEDDVIVRTPERIGAPVVIARRGQVVLASPTAQQPVTSREYCDAVEVDPSGTRIAKQHGRQLDVIDAVTGNVLWTSGSKGVGFSQMLWAGPHLFWSPGLEGSSWRDAETGEPLDVPIEDVEKRCGNLVLGWTGSGMSAFDVQSRRLLSPLPDVDVQKLAATPDGRQIVLPGFVGEKVVVARWNADDGRVIVPRPEGFEVTDLTMRLVDGGRFVVAERPEPSPWIFPHRAIATPLGIPTREIRLQRRQYVIADSNTGEVRGRVAFHGTMDPMITENFMVMADDDSVTIYDYPGRRDWRWIAVAIFSPIFTWLAVHFMFRRGSWRRAIGRPTRTNSQADSA